jgi:glucokinase
MTAAREVAIGIDIGGTTTSGGLVDADGLVLAHRTAPTPAGRAGSTLAAVLGVTQGLLGEAQDLGARVTGAGVGVPGTVDAETGTVGADVHNVPDLAQVALTETIRARFGLPAFADNDVNALALGEWTFGEGRGARSLVVMALGTGVGAGIILEGVLHRGHAGFGGELGHVPIDFDGRPCICGGRGCLKAYVAGPDIAARAGEAMGRPVDAAQVFELARGGDPAAAAVVEETLSALGAGLAIIVNGLNPERLLLTGSVAKSLAPLEARVREAVSRYAFARALAATRLSIVTRGKDATVRGGAALVRYETRRRAAPA